MGKAKWIQLLEDLIFNLNDETKKVLIEQVKQEIFKYEERAENTIKAYEEAKALVDLRLEDLAKERQLKTQELNEEKTKFGAAVLNDAAEFVVCLKNRLKL